MKHLGDRITAWLLRTAATAMLCAGASVFIAGVPLFGMASGTPVVAAIASIVLQLGAVFVVGGAAAGYLSRTQGLALPNERSAAADTSPTELGGWLILIAVALVGLPVLLVLRLQPFLAEWRVVAGLLATPGLWDNANANMSGVVLLPLAAALTPPFLELVAMAAFVVGSALLLLRLLARSAHFPRLYLVSLVLWSALVLASARGADAAAMAADTVRPLIESSPRPEEVVELRASLDRYVSAVTSALPVLVWTLCGYLVWMPAVLWSRRARATFARRVEELPSIPATTADFESITAPPRFPG